MSQEQIFEHYIGEKPQFDYLIRSPLRQDSNPTCGFRYSVSGTLFLKDFSGHFWGNCFDMVMYLHNCSFNEALSIVARDFKLCGGYNQPVNQNLRSDKETAKVIHTPSKIQIRIRGYNQSDLDYWKSFGITPAMLKLYGVYPCEMVYVNDRVTYRYDASDPAYAYRFGEGLYKIYFPMRRREDSGPRFYSNTSLIQGMSQLPEKGELLVITKSYKDVMLLRRFGIYAIAPSSESTGIGEEIIQELKKRFKLIIVVYDFDYAGVKYANKLKREAGFPALFLTNGRFGSENFGAKDPTDYFRQWGKGAFIALVHQTLRYVVERYRNT